MEKQEEISLEKYVKEITLPSGKKLQVIEAKGKHLREAQKVAGADKSDYMTFALASQICRIDGQKFVMEELDEMGLEDVAKITAAVGEYLI